MADNVTHLAFSENEGTEIQRQRARFVREAAEQSGDPLLAAVAHAWLTRGGYTTEAEAWAWTPVCHLALRAAERILGRRAP
jgi:hypothetical protein